VGSVTPMSSRRRDDLPGAPPGDETMSAVLPEQLAPGIERLAPWRPPGPSVLELLAGTAAGVGTALARPLVAPPTAAALTPLRARRRSSVPALAPDRREPALAPDRREPARRASAPWITRPGGPRSGPVPHGGGPGAVLDTSLAWRGTGEPDPVGDVPPGLADPGWFGPDSVAWRLHADTSMFVAGLSAFALQALHPLALAGVADHSSFATDFLGRVQRTGEFVQGVVYGTSAEAERHCAAVRRVHRQVVGTAPDGRPYSANDPELLEWVHLGEYAAIAAAYRRFGARPLSDADLDRYVAEVGVVGEAMGVGSPPRSWAELDARLQRFRPSLAVGEQAVVALRFLREPPGLPAAVRPAWRVAFAGATACLPPFARRLLSLPEPSPESLVACRCLVRALAVALGPPPPLVAARSRLGL
jgi:uncharacterized protein (DUF2236 family)